MTNPKPTLAPLFLVLVPAFLLAGCVGNADAGLNPDDAAEAAPSASSAAIVIPFSVTDCMNPRWFFFIPKAYAQSLLPPGFHASEAMEALGAIGIPVPTGVIDSGYGVGFYDALDCATHSLGPGRLQSSNVGVFVDPPTIPGGPSEPTPINFYALVLPTSDPAWRSALSVVMPPEDVPPLSIRWRYDDLLHDGTGSGAAEAWIDGERWALIEYQTATPSDAGPVIDTRIRGWHNSPLGTFFLEAAETVSNAAGTATVCDHAPARAYAWVTNTVDCVASRPTALIAHHQDLEGTLNLLPGVFPEP